jgi:hypothetical protein
MLKILFPTNQLLNEELDNFAPKPVPGKQEVALGLRKRFAYDLPGSTGTLGPWSK